MPLQSGYKRLLDADLFFFLLDLLKDVRSNFTTFYVPCKTSLQPQNISFLQIVFRTLQQGVQCWDVSTRHVIRSGLKHAHCLPTCYKCSTNAFFTFLFCRNTFQRHELLTMTAPRAMTSLVQMLKWKSLIVLHENATGKQTGKDDTTLLTNI